jgi:hypothetical protein
MHIIVGKVDKIVTFSESAFYHQHQPVAELPLDRQWFSPRWSSANEVMTSWSLKVFYWSHQSPTWVIWIEMIIHFMFVVISSPIQKRIGWRNSFQEVMKSLQIKGE